MVTKQAAWMLLKDKYPGKFSHGCVSHRLHLLVKEIFSARKAKCGQKVIFIVLLLDRDDEQEDELFDASCF